MNQQTPPRTESSSGRRILSFRLALRQPAAPPGTINTPNDRQPVSGFKGSTCEQASLSAPPFTGLDRPPRHAGAASVR